MANAGSSVLSIRSLLAGQPEAARAMLGGATGRHLLFHCALIAWLAGNLFFGSQLAWIGRPFIGSPTLPVEFLRPDALHGNFYEAVFRSVADLLK